MRKSKNNNSKLRKAVHFLECHFNQFKEKLCISERKNDDIKENTEHIIKIH